MKRIWVPVLVVMFFAFLFTDFLAAPVVEAHPRPNAIRRPGGCQRRIARPRKQQRCVACVQGGGHFHKGGRGPGFCHQPGAR
jgi:hypothetical protein